MPFRILYLDDETALLDIFVETYSAPGLEIEAHTEPAQALESIRLRPPDLVLLDHRLPGITGDEIALGLDPAICKALVTGDLISHPMADFAHIFRKPYAPAEMQTFIDLCRTGKRT